VGKHIGGGSDPIRDAEVALGLGRRETARGLLQRYIEQDPDHSGAAQRLASIAFEDGDLVSASMWLERAVASTAAPVQAMVDLGKVNLALDKVDAAERLLQEAILRHPHIPSAFSTLAMVRLRQERTAEAVRLLERAVELSPHDADIISDLGGALRKAGRIDQALAMFTRAIELRDDFLPFWMNLGFTRMQSRQWDLAALAFRRALVLDDRYAPGWTALGVALSEIGQDLDAEKACREALVLRPGWSEGIENLAGVLALQGRVSEAENELRSCLERTGTWSAGWRKLAGLNAARGALSDAESALRQALEIDPESALIKFDLAHVLLAQCKYAEGFELFESRFAAAPAWYTDEVRTIGLDRTERRWSGGSVANRHVLVIGEQGFGDQLMMFRYLPALQTLGPSAISVACAPELLRIAERVAGVSSVVSTSSSVRPKDAELFVPALSLPFCFRSTSEDLPPAAYLHLNASESNMWPQLEGLSGLRVGMVWAGNSTADDRARRGFTLDTLEPLANVRGVSFVSLQKGAAAASGFPQAWVGKILDPMDECADFFDTATVLANLDLVICVDTAVAHLAGAMGLPVWLVLKAAGEWRWGVSSTTSTWYPRTRIFRQKHGGGWAEVAEALRTALMQEVAERGPYPCGRIRDQQQSSAAS